MAQAEQVTDAEVNELAEVWYGMLDRHDPVDGYLPLLAPDVEFQFPEGTVRGLEGFQGWYDGVIRVFFDEVHTLKEVTPTLKDGQVEVKVVVNWQASRWNPPAAASERINADARQTWTVQRSPETNQAVISRYVVDGLEYMPRIDPSLIGFTRRMNIMSKPPDTPLGRMYEEHIHLILKKDIDGLLNQYTEDALLISSFMKEPVCYKGHEQLKEHFQGILGIQGMEVEIAFWAESEDPQTLMIVEAITMSNADGSESSMRFADSWVLRDGKIAIHFAGMTQYPDGSVA